MIIRPVETRDIPQINAILKQISDLHSALRPDIFKRGREKFTEEELAALLARPERPSFVAEEDGVCVGYSLCEIKETASSPHLVSRKVLYLDDLCVDEKFRGKGIGKALTEYTVEYAESIGADAVELNAWEANTHATAFYERLGFKTQRREMEIILK